MAGPSNPISRRRFLLTAPLAGGAAAFGAWHSLLYSPSNPRVSHRRLALAGLPAAFDGLTMVQLSDLHHSDLVSLSYLENCVRRTNGLRPDVIVLTGDYITMERSRNRRQIIDEFMTPLAELLSSLRAPLGVYAVLGNHDVSVNSAMVQRALEVAGVTVLRNGQTRLNRGDASLPVVGLADLGTERVREAAAFADLSPEEPALVMMHSPDLFGRGMRHRNGLVLAGHTHGGQVRFPFIGPLYVPSEFGDRYAQGTFEESGLTMIVNRGLGVVNFRARLNCPPEIAHVTLARA